MPTLEQFARRISLIGTGVVEEADRLVRTVALAADQVVVLRTPVDKGRARSNWIVGLDAPPRTTIEPYSPGEKGSTGGANGSAALAQGAAVISGYSGWRNSSIAISNNLPYIDRLNKGWSRQAPAGFVEAAVQKAVRAVKRARLIK